MGTDDTKTSDKKVDDAKGKLQSISGFAQQYDRVRAAAYAAMPVKPLVFSVDGRTFGYEAPIQQAFRVGSYVRIKTMKANYLGQITAQDVATREGPQYGLSTTANAGIFIARSTTESNFVDRIRIRYVSGGGELIGRLVPDGIQRTTHQDVFENAELELAHTDVISSYFAIDRKHRMEVGYASGAEPGKVRVQLQPKGFRRHTFMCGQSRSGKTFALGVILEQLLLAKDGSRIIILDPNSDFVRLNRIRTKKEHDLTLRTPKSARAYAAIKSKYQHLTKEILAMRPEPLTPALLKVRLSDLDPYEQGAVLQLDPIRDLDAFHNFSSVVEGMRGKTYSWQVIHERLVSAVRESTSGLVMRLQNLRVADWDVWCKTQEPSMAETLSQKGWRCAEVDVGTLPSSDQRMVAAIAVLNYVWKTKNPKKPVLLVLDEAHNICPQEPVNQLQEIATDYIIRIAGEGLKYGLRLLLVSQRPAKIHASILTQCENLILMRMNSRADVESLAYTFSQVPPTLLGQSKYFVQGESLILGEIVKSPTFAKFEGRLSHEGGADA